MALAASMAAVAIGIQAVGYGSPTLDPLATYATGVGESRTVTLDDGTFVRLAPDSRLHHWTTEGSRRVSLSGRAFFAVTHDPERPFEVVTDAGTVRVLGTRFELSQSEGNLRAVVVEGRVAVTNDNGAVEAAKGSVATVVEGGVPTSDTPVDIYSLLSWPGGILIFQSTPLDQAAQEVARHFGRAIVVEGERLRARRISAWFDGENFDEITESLCVVSGAECTLSDSSVVMRLEDGDEEVTR
jgi:transmembrane sensor